MMVSNVQEGFREELLNKRKKELDLITSQFLPGAHSRDKVAETIIRSVIRRKDAANVEDSTIYQVARWLANNKVTEVYSKNELYRRISKSTGLPDFTIAHCLRTNPFKLPTHLQTKTPVEREPKKVMSREVVGVDQPATDEFTAMKSIASVVDKLDETTRKRVLRWTIDRAGIKSE